MRSVWRLGRLAGHGVAGLATVTLRFGRLDAAARHAAVGAWSRRVFERLGIELAVHGAPLPGAKLIVANHVSWLDIHAIHAVCPEARFVSKADVRRWPLLNRLVDSAGTLYLERERSRDALRVVHQMAAALREGDTVAVFPEGTTGDGHALLPFHANLMQAAVATGVPVQPVALRFSEPGHAVSPAAMFVGDTTLVQSMARVAAARALRLELRWLEPLELQGMDRRALAGRARDLIGGALG